MTTMTKMITVGSTTIAQMALGLAPQLEGTGSTLPRVETLTSSQGTLGGCNVKMWNATS